MGQATPINTHAILLVEDEVLIRIELADFFTDAGYRVFEAGDADEAIGILEKEQVIRIVLTDIQLPGSVDGLKLAHFIRDRYPPTVLLLTSGGVDIDDASLPKSSKFIAKPFDPTRILLQIQQLTRPDMR